MEMTASAATEASAQCAAPIALSVSGVGHTYASEDGARSVRALSHVDVEIARGEFFAIVGPSGCGKSTLLDIIAGLCDRLAKAALPFEGHTVRRGRFARWRRRCFSGGHELSLAVGLGQRGFRLAAPWSGRDGDHAPR